MEARKLLKKYNKGKHWEARSTIYAERFSKFLKKHNFKGLLIDVGCGIGKDTDFFHRNDFEVIGIDISKKELRSAGLRYPKCHFEHQSIEHLSFENNSIAAFFVVNVIHYTKKNKTIKEMYRTLKKGGYVFIHFNTMIKDELENVDYKQAEKEIIDMISDFNIVAKKTFIRKDENPIKHVHKILELALQKK